MNKRSLLCLFLFVVTSTPQLTVAQLGGYYHMTGVNVQYTYVIRPMDSADDSTDGTYSLTASWPNSANALYTHTLPGAPHFSVGDTLPIINVPLHTPTALQYGLSSGPIDLYMSVSDEGQMQITGTYPAVAAVDCSTASTVPPVNDNGTYSLGSCDPLIDSTANIATFGFGITTSGIFANQMHPVCFTGPNAEVEGTDYGIGTNKTCWGKVDVQYTDNTFSTIDSIIIYWEAQDGVATTLGVNTAGQLNRHFGSFGAFGDSSTTTALHAINPAINVGTYPIIGGSGADLNQNDTLDNVIAAPNLEWGYLFDPKGPDGELFTGDEPMRFTGYYFTRHFLIGVGTIQTVLGADANGDGIPDNLYAVMGGGLSLSDAINQLAGTFWNALWPQLATSAEFDLDNDGDVDAADSTLAAGYATQIGTYATTVLASQLVQVALGSLTQAEALTNTGSAVAVYALQILGTMGITVDDSDHDFNGVNGRLVFQIDNVCVPIFSTQRVNPWFDYVGGASIESDESLIPNKFALFDNYPNPFNPTTQIAVDLPEAAFTELTVWNIMGQKVVTLHSGELNAGRHTISFDGRDTNGKQLTSGMYIYRVKAGKYNATKKMTLMK